MPWCESKDCGKRDLKKEDVVFDDLRQQVLCIPCAQADKTSSDALKAEVIEKTWFGVGYSSDEGLKAELVHGGARVALHVSNDQMMKFLGS